MIYLLLFSCVMHRQKSFDIGAVDIISNQTCSIQLKDDSVVYLKSKLCKNLKEGDVIIVRRQL